MRVDEKKRMIPGCFTPFFILLSISKFQQTPGTYEKKHPWFPPVYASEILKHKNLYIWGIPFGYMFQGSVGIVLDSLFISSTFRRFFGGLSHVLPSLSPFTTSSNSRSARRAVARSVPIATCIGGVVSKKTLKQQGGPLLVRSI